MVQLNFGGVIENVMARKGPPLEKTHETLGGKIITAIGYGVQGPNQVCDLHGNGSDVIVGQRQSRAYKKVVADGWALGEILLNIEDAC